MSLLDRTMVRDRIEESSNSLSVSPQKLTSFLVKDILGLDGETNYEAVDNSSQRSIDRTESNVLVKIKEASQSQNGSFFTEISQHCDPQNKSRSPFRDKQRMILETRFNKSKYISLGDRKKLAAELHLTERQVKTWFQNRRTKWRKTRGNEGLLGGISLEDRENSGTAQILSNAIDKISPKWVNQLHKELTAQKNPSMKG